MGQQPSELVPTFKADGDLVLEELFDLFSCHFCLYFRDYNLFKCRLKFGSNSGDAKILKYKSYYIFFLKQLAGFHLFSRFEPYSFASAIALA